MEQIKAVGVHLAKEQLAFKVVEAEYNAQKKIVTALKEEMQELMEEAGTATYSSDLATISLRHSQIPISQDWNEVYEYIHKHEAYDILQQRLSMKACKDRIEEEGALIPGIEMLDRTTVAIKLK